MRFSESELNLRCSNCDIRHRAVCSGCDAGELNSLNLIKYYKTYKAGQTIASVDQPISFVASVVTGIATLSQTMEDGRTQMVGMLLPSDFVGRPGRETVAYDVVATTDVYMCCFHKKPFENLLATTPHLVQRLLEMTLDDLDAAREWMLVLGRKTAREKIASLLAIIAQRTALLKRKAGEDKVEMDLPLSRDQMSDYLGLTIETVSRQLSALKKDGIIIMPSKRHVIVPSLSDLVNEAGDDSDGGVFA